MPLRNFLYLDSAAVDGYLSQLEGVLTEGTYSTKIQTSGGKEGNIGFGVPGMGISAGGKAGSTQSQEIDRTFRETPETRFSRLRKLLTTSNELEDDERLQVINAADSSTFQRIQAGEIIEIRGVGRLPRWEHFRKEMAEVQAYSKVVAAFGVIIQDDPQAKAMLEQIDALSAVTPENETILMVTPEGASRFTIFTKLLTTNLLRATSVLENEITITGKVIRQLAPGQKQDVVRLMPRLEAVYDLTKKSKGPRGRIERPKTDTPYDEVIGYPALELSTIAVFQ